MQTVSPAQSRGADHNRDFRADGTPERPDAITLVPAHDTGNRIPTIGNDNDHLQ
jgi:hypothetical protein